MEGKPYNIRTTVISPGAMATELPHSVTEPDVARCSRPATSPMPHRRPARQWTARKRVLGGFIARIGSIGFAC